MDSKNTCTEHEWIQGFPYSTSLPRPPTWRRMEIFGWCEWGGGGSRFQHCRKNRSFLGKKGIFLAEIGDKHRVFWGNFDFGSGPTFAVNVREGGKGGRPLSQRKRRDSSSGGGEGQVCYQNERIKFTTLRVCKAHRVTLCRTRAPVAS